MLNLVDLTGKRIMIAGASSGIGRQTAITLSQLGAELILIARRENLLQETLTELDGSGHSYYCCDLSDTQGIGNMVKQIVAERGPLDGLAYIAGISKLYPIGLTSPEKMEEMFRINYFGFFEMVRQTAKNGRFNPGMRIVAVSSIAAVCGDPAHTAYSASKAAIDGAIRCMAKELAPKGICLNSVAPAMTNTVMFDKFGQKLGEGNGSERFLLQRQYMGIAEPADVANAIAFLISPAARFITGTRLFVDGGYTSC